MYRRERVDVVQLFKIMNNFDHVELRSISVGTNSITRGHKHNLEKRHYRYKSYMRNFTARYINPWNALPCECIDASSVNSFKNQLNKAWKQKTNKFIRGFVTTTISRVRMIISKCVDK